MPDHLTPAAPAKPGLQRRWLFAILALAVSQAHAITNVVSNAGFETGAFAPWATYGNHAVESTNNTYYNGGLPGGSNVLTHSGRYVGKTYGSFTGGYNVNGAYQDAVAAPGSVWSRP